MMPYYVSEETIQRQLQEKGEFYDLPSLELRKTSYWQTAEIDKEDATAIRYAKAYAHFLKTKPICLREFDAFAGLIQHYDMSASMPIRYAENYHPAIYPVYTREADMQQEVAQLGKYLHQADAQDVLGELKNGMESGLFAHGPYGHVIPGFDFVIRTGWKAIQERLERDHKDPARRDYNAALKIVVHAASYYTLRYASEAERMAAETSNEEYRQNLQTLPGRAVGSLMSRRKTFLTHCK